LAVNTVSETTEIADEFGLSVESAGIRLSIDPSMITASFDRHDSRHPTTALLIRNMDDDMNGTLDNPSCEAFIARKPWTLHHVLNGLIDCQLSVFGMDGGHRSIMSCHQRLANRRHFLTSRLAEYQAVGLKA
jgi:hypothetical protein